MIASISGQNSANLKEGRKGRQSYHIGTYFFPLQALKKIIKIIIILFTM